MIVCLMIDCKGEGHRENLEKALRGLGYVTTNITDGFLQSTEEVASLRKQLAEERTK